MSNATITYRDDIDGAVAVLRHRSGIEQIALVGYRDEVERQGYVLLGYISPRAGERLPVWTREIPRVCPICGLDMTSQLGITRQAHIRSHV